MEPNQIEPASTPAYRLASLILEQDVREWILQQRNTGLTWRKTGRRLHDATGGQLDVTDQTLRNWAGVRSDVA